MAALRTDVVDVVIVHGLLNERLGDFIEFARYVSAHLEESK